MRRFLMAVCLLSVIYAALFLYMSRVAGIPVSIVDLEEPETEVLSVSGSTVTASELSGALLMQAARAVEAINAGLLTKPDGFDSLDGNARLDLAASLIRESGWPFDSIPDDVPAYVHGTVRSFGNSAQGMYAVIDSDAQSVDAYRDLLRFEQYIVSSDGSTARRGERQIKLWHDGENTLYLSATQLKYDPLWPSEKTPDFLYPAPGKSMAHEADIISQDGSLYSMRAEFEQMDGEDARNYMESLALGLDKAELDTLSMNGETTWNGRNWWVYAELYKQEDNRAVFSYAWGIRQGE